MSEEIKEVKKRGRKKKSEGNTEEIENIKKETFSEEVKEVKKRGRKPKKKTTGEANLQLLATSKRGRDAHRNYKNALPGSYRFEVVLDNGRRVDAINFDEKIVRELKPDTPSGIAKGNSQLAEYVAQLEEQTGDTWTGFLDTYTP